MGAGAGAGPSIGSIHFRKILIIFECSVVSTYTLDNVMLC